MHAELNPIDSEVIGANVVEVYGFSEEEDPAAFEARQILPLEPRYAFLKVPAERIGSIHRLEDLGFRYAEFQITMRHRLKRRIAAGPFPYHFELVKREEDLAVALEMAGSIFTHDRYSTDPALSSDVSGRRYQAYLRKSFAAADESVYVMKNDETGKIVSFGTLRRLGPAEVRLLIGGVAKEYKDSGLGAIHDYVGLQTYYDEGIRLLHTGVSGINYPIVNLEIAHLGFKVEQSYVVLRKHYGMLP